MRLLTMAGFLGLGLLLIPARVHGCVCDIHGDGSPRSEMRYAKAVFIGEVLQIRETTLAEREAGSSFGKVRLRVERYWKGVKAGEVVVETEGDCGAFFRVGNKYLVYARGRHLTTGCMRIRSIESAEEDLKALGPGKEFKAK